MEGLEMMSDADIKRMVLDHIPPSEHEEAIYRIRRAELDGIEDIGLCTGEEPPSVDDLMGNQEGEPRTFTLQGSPVTITRWAIWLSKYASTNTQGIE
jgi:hypothetical protein